MDNQTKSVERVIGLDAHPDSFTAAVIGGPTPAAATVEKIFNKLPLSQLPIWAKKHANDKDLIVLEASGNSFQIVRKLNELGRRALVLESCHLGKLKEAHANNEKISAVRIGKAYLAGTAKEVWARPAERRIHCQGRNVSLACTALGPVMQEQVTNCVGPWRSRGYSCGN